MLVLLILVILGRMKHCIVCFRDVGRHFVTGAVGALRCENGWRKASEAVAVTCVWRTGSVPG